MVKVHAFKGVYFNREKVGALDRVVAPPYDVISPELKKELYKRHENNVIRLILGEEAGENREQGLYEKAASYFNEWLEKGILLREEKECVYVYEQVFEVEGQGKKSRRGLILMVGLEPFEKKEVLGHEATLSGPKKDRLELMRATKANFSQIFSLYSGESGKIREIIDGKAKEEPFLEAMDGNGIENRVWRVSREKEVEVIKKEIENVKLFIADGHHRYETALAYQKENPKAGKAMMLVVDTNDEGLVVLPTHRLVKEIENFEADEFIEKLKEFFEVSEVKKELIPKKLEENKESHCFGVCVKGKAFAAKAGKEVEGKLKEGNAFLQKLDVTVLHEIVLERILGITKEMVARKEKIEYVKGFNEAVKGVEEGKAQIAFILNPTKVEQVKNVAESCARMPQKSTYFYPKVLTGLIMNKID